MKLNPQLELQAIANWLKAVRIRHLKLRLLFQPWAYEWTTYTSL